MKRKTIIRLCLILAAFVFVSGTSAQSVPASMRREIARQIECEQTISIQARKIGPSKRGYFVECNYPGGGDAYVFENTKNLFRGERGMNGSISLSKSAHGAYYDVIIEGHSISGSISEFYKWTGKSFVRYKCEELEFDRNGKIIKRSGCNF